MNEQLLILSSSRSILKEMWLQEVTAAPGDFFLFFSSLKDLSESTAQVCLPGFFFLNYLYQSDKPGTFSEEHFLLLLKSVMKL